MKRCVLIILTVILAASAPAAQDLERLFKAAVNTETVDRNCREAIEQYRKVAAGTNRPLAAQALLRMAGCHQRLGDDEAQKIYRRLIDEFSEQKDIVAIARTRLEPSSNASRTTTSRDIVDLNASGNVTADGRYATFVNWDTGNIGVRDLVSGTSREVTARKDFSVYNPVISRDGRFVAYQSFNGCIWRPRPNVANSNGVLCVLAIAGEPAESATTVVELDDIRQVTPMDWSPDGNAMAVVLQRKDGTAQIGIVSVASRAVKVLQTTDWRGATRIFFSPDARYVAFDVPNGEATDQLDIRVVAVDGSRGSTLTQDSSQNVVMGWTPDGRSVLIASDRAGSMGLWAQRVTDGRPDGLARLVHAGLGGALSLGITREGTLYFGLQRGDRDVEVVTLDMASGKQTLAPVRPIARYVGTNLMPEWSRDGRYLAYVSQRGLSGNGGRVIGIRDTTTGAVRELRPKMTYINGLNWAPDNRALVTTGTDFRGRDGVFTIDVQTGDAAFITEGEYPRYAPDGDRIFYGKSAERPLKTVIERSLTTGAERTVLTGEFAQFTVSPDGKWLAIPMGGVIGSSAQEIVVVSLATGERRTVYRAKPGERIPPYVGLPWTPDGQAVLMRQRAPNEELWLVPINGGPPRKIEAQIKGWGFGPAGVISLHSDGRQLAGTKLREDAGPEVRVLENFISALK